MHPLPCLPRSRRHRWLHRATSNSLHRRWRRYLYSNGPCSYGLYSYGLCSQSQLPSQKVATRTPPPPLGQHQMNLGQLVRQVRAAEPPPKIMQHLHVAHHIALTTAVLHLLTCDALNILAKRAATTSTGMATTPTPRMLASMSCTIQSTIRHQSDRLEYEQMLRNLYGRIILTGLGRLRKSDC